VADLVPVNRAERFVSFEEVVYELRGAPAPGDRLERGTLPDGGTIALASNVSGTRDYPDLRRSARTAQLDDGTSVPVAHPRDLLRMADASPRESERARVPGLRALLSHTVDRTAQT